MRSDHYARILFSVTQFKRQVRRLGQPLTVVVCHLSVANNAIVVRTGEAVDFSRLAKIIFDDIEQLLRDSIFLFSRKRKTALSQLFERSQQNPANKENHGQTEVRMR